MPSTESLTELGVREAADHIRRGVCSSVALVEACLARVRALEPQVLAWAHLDADGALAAARERDAEAAAGRPRGPLHGVPVGIKDIFDVAGMPTTAGAREFAHTRPTRDCGAVARLRAAGAVILGKTHTTQFAFRDPSPTRNPWNPAPHAGRLVVRLGCRGRRPHGAGRHRLADGRLDPAAGGVLRRGRAQGTARAGAGRRRGAAGVVARPRGAVRALRRRRRADAERAGRPGRGAGRRAGAAAGRRPPALRPRRARAAAPPRCRSWAGSPRPALT